MPASADVAHMLMNWNRMKETKQELIMMMVVALINFLMGVAPEDSQIDNWAHGVRA
jgi:hypothetical protein